MEMAYIAGLFDGEGSVGIYKSTNGKSSKVYYSVKLSIVGTYRPMIESVYKEFNIGSFTTQKRQAVHSTPRGAVLGKQGWRWSVTDKNGVYHVLQTIRPYLIEKASQADIVLDYLDGKYNGKEASIMCKKAKKFEFSASEFEEYAPRKNSGNNSGELNGSAKLTEKEAIAIKKLHAEGKTATEIAKVYGVNKTTTSRIINGRSWGNP